MDCGAVGGIFAGLILYLDFRIKQGHCLYCDTVNLTSTAICSSCGQVFVRDDRSAEDKKSQAIVCVAFILLIFTAYALFMVSFSDSMSASQSYQSDAWNLSLNFSHDVWNLSFAEVPYGQSFTQSFDKQGHPKTVQIVAAGEGKVEVSIRQGSRISVGVIEEGSHVFELGEVDSDSVEVSIANIDAENFSATVTVNR